MANDTPYWFRISIRWPSAPESEPWVMDLSWGFMRALEAFFPYEKDAPSVSKGEFNIFTDSTITLPQTSNTEMVVFVKAIGYSGVHLNPVFKPAHVEKWTAELRQWLLGMMFGLMIAMILYNFFLYIPLRDISYLWYILHIFFIALYYSAMNGLGFYLNPSTSYQNFISNYSFFSVVCVCMFFCMGMFARSFLMVDSRHRLLGHLLTLQAALCGVLLLVLVLAGPIAAITFTPVVAMSTSLIIVAAGLVRLVQGFRPAGIFLAGWTLYVVCGTVHSLAWAGVLPPSPITMYAPEVGSSIEIMVMAFALAYRIKILREEKERAECDLRLLAHENALFSLILDNSQLGLGLVQDGHFAWANRQLQGMAGREAPLAGSHIDELPGFGALLGDNGAYDENSVTRREGRTGPPGDQRDMRALGKAVSPGSATHQGVVWVVEDVTEQRKLQKFRDDVERIIRHDIKTPLGNLHLMAQLALVKKDEDLLRHHLPAILPAIRQVIKLLDSSDKIMRMELGRYIPMAHRSNLNQVLLNAIRSLREMAENRGVSIMVDDMPGSKAARSSIEIQAEEFLVEDMLVNLIKNAIEGSPRGHDVSIDIHQGDDVVRIAIHNDGTIPERIRANFFGKDVTADKPGGAGLGTYVALLIAKAHRGTIEVASSEEDGTTITVVLPRPPRA